MKVKNEGVIVSQSLSKLFCNNNSNMQGVYLIYVQNRPTILKTQGIATYFVAQLDHIDYSKNHSCCNQGESVLLTTRTPKTYRMFNTGG